MTDEFNPRALLRAVLPDPLAALASKTPSPRKVLEQLERQKADDATEMLRLVLHNLMKSYRDGGFRLECHLQYARDPDVFTAVVDALAASSWEVYFSDVTDARGYREVSIEGRVS